MNNSQRQKQLLERLDKIPEKLIEDGFQKNKGLGNEIGFYVFDYAPEFESLVAEQIIVSTERLKRMGRKFSCINLFDLLFDLLEDEGILDNAFEMHKEDGNEALLEALHGTINQENFSTYLCEKVQPEKQEFVLLTGLGACWPLIRGHSLLNALQSRMGQTPLVLFFPGNYTGLELHPFGKIESSNYYRAFELIPHKK